MSLLTSDAAGESQAVNAGPRLQIPATNEDRAHAFRKNTLQALSNQMLWMQEAIKTLQTHEAEMLASDLGHLYRQSSSLADDLRRQLNVDTDPTAGPHVMVWHKDYMLLRQRAEDQQARAN